MRRNGTVRRLAPRRLLRPAVERVEGRVLLATFVVMNTNDDTNMGSLRYAITQSNLTPGSNTINFDIANSGVQTIALTSALPAITVPVTINGTTEPGYAGTPLIELDGAGAGGTANAPVDGLDVTAGGSTIEGLAINRFTGCGIGLTVVGGDTIEHDFLGTDPTGKIAEGNDEYGVAVGANCDNNSFLDNVASGNGSGGISLDGANFTGTAGTTSGNLVAGNLLGTDVTGTVVLNTTNFGINTAGIEIGNATGNTIGGTTSAARNIISGNGAFGILVRSNTSNLVIEGNYIGTDITGTVGLSNEVEGLEGTGIALVANGSGTTSNITIGGTTAGSGNLISDNNGTATVENAQIGVFGNPGSTNFLVAGNLIGTDVTGTKSLGGNNDGIDDDSTGSVTIGGTVPGDGNLISGNVVGINAFMALGTLIEGNFIGTDGTGTKSVANQNDGVLISNNSNVTIGGTNAGARNVVSGNDVATNNGLGGGIVTSAPRTLIEGNFIGTDITGSRALGNEENGVLVFGAGSNTTIGGTVSGAGNLISANLGGINAGDATTTGVLIQGNLIGTDITGTVALGGGTNGGINISNGDTVGGTVAGAGNLISGCSETGVFVGGDNDLVEGNMIGTDITGTLPLGNGATGVGDVGTNDTIGGLAAGAGNIIAYNGAGTTPQSSGISVVQDGVTILSNVIHDNQVSGITESIVSGPPAIPVLTSAVTTSTSCTISGNLTDAAGTYTLQFFANAGLDASGNAEGEILLGTATVTITGTFANFTESFITPFNPGAYITATETNSAGSTSVFSTGIVGTQEPVPPTISVTTSAPSVPAGQPIIYTFTIANPATIAEEFGVIFDDPIPPGTTFVSASGNGVPVSFAGGVVTGSIGTLDGGQVVTISVTLTPSLSDMPSFTNTGEVTATSPLVTSGMATASATTEVTPSADLEVAITSPTKSPQNGQPLVYTVRATNKGPSPATGIILSDTLPADVTLVSATSSSGQVVMESAGMVAEMLATLAAGASEVLTITVVPTSQAPPSVTDTAAVSANEFDPDPTNNFASLATNVSPVADVAIVSDTASAGIPYGPVLVGDLITFTIIVANNGPSPTTGVVVDDALPTGLTFVSGTATGGNVTLVGGSVYSAPVGDLAPGETSFVTIVAKSTEAGTFSDMAAVGSDLPDPVPGNNTNSGSIVVEPLTYLTITLSGPAGPVYAGDVLTYTSVVTNNGPSPATGVRVLDTIPAGVKFVSIEADGVIGSLIDNNEIASVPIGDLAVGASATVTVMLIPTVPGTVVNQVELHADLDDFDPNPNTATVSTLVIEPQSFITFDVPAYETTEDSGFAAIAIDRSGDLEQAVSVRFSTVPGGNATPGVDYIPVSGTVDFPPGATQEFAFVQVLPNPYDNHNEVVNLKLDSPSGNGVIAPVGLSEVNAPLTIVDLDPDDLGPVVTDVKLTGPISSITAIEIDTTGHLDPVSASNPNNYTITAQGGAGKSGLPMGTIVPVAAFYNPTLGSVFLIPSKPLPANEVFLIRVNGSQPGAVTDLAGNPLNSAFDVTPGSDYLLSVARGTNITYQDENDDSVNLKVSGPGVVDIDRYPVGSLEKLQVVGGVAYKTVVTGVIHPNRPTEIGSILGIGQFGTIRLKMTTPPFYVDNLPYPNLATQVDPPAEDTLLPSPTPPPPAKKSKPAPKVKAASVETHHSTHPASHPSKVKEESTSTQEHAKAAKAPAHHAAHGR